MLVGRRRVVAVVLMRSAVAVVGVHRSVVMSERHAKACRGGCQSLHGDREHKRESNQETCPAKRH